jgi:hypothetical protein
VVPGIFIWMTPPYAQLHVEASVRAGLPPTLVCGDPGTHGAGMTGRHAPGVSTPKAAAVWAAVIGFARLEHTPNGGMFTNGFLSMIDAIGFFSAITLAIGRTFKVDGATPNEHCSIAPVATGFPMRPTVPGSSSPPGDQR